MTGAVYALWNWYCPGCLEHSEREYEYEDEAKRDYERHLAEDHE